MRSASGDSPEGSDHSDARAIMEEPQQPLVPRELPEPPPRPDSC